MTNKELIKKYPWLKIRNVWTDSKIDEKDEYTWFDDIPEGWKRAFGLKLCEELNQLLIKANYQDDYRITQIKEKWRIFTLV